MKRSLVSLFFLLLCSVAYANQPNRCDNLSDGGGSCNASDDCQNQCALMVPPHAGLNPLLPGFVTGYVDRQLVVTGVIPYSPASEVGIKTGDRLISVDGIRLPAPYGLNSVWQQGSQHRLAVERSGKILHFSLTPIPEQVVLARVWSEFDPLAEQSMRLLAYGKHQPALGSFPAHKAFLTGLRIVRGSGGFAVDEVLSGSAAEAAGIHKGDIVLHADGNEEASDSRRTVVLTVQRGHERLHFRLRMNSLSEVLTNLAERRQTSHADSANAGL